MTPAEREQLILDHLPQVRALAARFYRHCFRQVEYEDLAAVGACALVAAVDRYDQSRGATLRTYASNRIWGAMLDYLQLVDPLDERHRRDVKAGVAIAVHFIPIDFRIDLQAPVQPESSDRILISELMRVLSDRQRFAVQAFLRDQQQSETAREMGITTSAVSHIRTTAIAKMRRAACA